MRKRKFFLSESEKKTTKIGQHFSYKQKVRVSVELHTGVHVFLIAFVTCTLEPTATSTKGSETGKQKKRFLRNATKKMNE